MRMARLITGTICCGLLVGVLTGCTPDARELQIQSLTMQLEECRRGQDDLRSQIARAYSERDGAMSRNGQLMGQIRDLQNQLANQPVIERPVPAPVTHVDPVPSGWQAGPGGVAWVDVGNRILFRQGYADVLPEGKAELQRIVNDINASFGDKLIVVIGHTDNTPIKAKKHVYKDNLDLSVTRGAAVFRELARLGISTQRMIAAGQGEYLPKVANSSPQNMQVNRRVQILAVPMPEGGSLGADIPYQPAIQPATSNQPVDLIEK